MEVSLLALLPCSLFIIFWTPHTLPTRDSENAFQKGLCLLLHSMFSILNMFFCHLKLTFLAAGVNSHIIHSWHQNVGNYSLDCCFSTNVAHLHFKS